MSASRHEKSVNVERSSDRDFPRISGIVNKSVS